jgi:hypothetical protein
VGWFGEHIGPRWALGIGGLAAVCAAVLGWRLLGIGSGQQKKATEVDQDLIT